MRLLNLTRPTHVECFHLSMEKLIAKKVKWSGWPDEHANLQMSPLFEVADKLSVDAD